MFIVRTGMCAAAAAAAGAVRAMTLRFWTLAGGTLTWARAFAVPAKLALPGRKTAPFVTCAPRKDAAVMCMLARFTAWPFTKASREAALTAFALCAYA